jgi:uncharacterized protein YbaR (Trm112 family)
MSERKRPVSPVKPKSLELLFLYACPYCGGETPSLSPTEPTMLQCPACKQNFPIVPVDDKTVRFIKIMLAGGKAAVDPNFL